MTGPGALVPGKLWSLREMLEIKAKPFVVASDLLAQAMASFKDPSVDSFDPETVELLSRLFNELRAESLKLEVSRNTIMSIDRLVENLNRGRRPAAIYHQAIELRSRLHDDLEGVFVLFLSLAERDLYAPSAPLFGQDVEDKFNVAEDIAEAGKCLALGRTTSSVFHLMRTVEAAVKKLGEALNVTVVDKHNVDLAWGPILANINAAVGDMPKGDRKDEWSHACSLLYHVKQAWRNDTMHPKRTYTEKEAKKVFDATGAFMQALAQLI